MNRPQLTLIRHPGQQAELIMPIEIELPQLEQIISELAAVREEVRALREGGSSEPPKKDWYSLKECCERKNVSFSTIQKPAYRYLMPPNPTRVGCKLMYSAETVEWWVKQTDEDMRRFCEHNGRGVGESELVLSPSSPA